MHFLTKHIARIFCLLFALNVMALGVQAQDDGDDDGFSVELDLDQVNIHATGYDSPYDMTSHKAVMFPEHKHSKKFQSVKHINFKVIVPQFVIPAIFQVYDVAVNTPVLPHQYKFLFYRKINPPPPKSYKA